MGATTKAGPGRLGQVLGLVRAADPVATVATAATLGLIAALLGRTTAGVASTFGAVALALAALGLINDVCDRHLDLAAGVDDKPIASGRVDPSNALWLAAILLIVSVPVSLLNGTIPAVIVAIIVVVGLIHNRWLHRTPASALAWMITFGLFPAYLTYGGSGVGVHGGPPTVLVTGLSALLGLGVHFATTLPDLVGDHTAGVKNLPLKIAMRTGAPALLFVTIGYTIVVAGALAGVAFGTGVAQ